MRFIFLLLGLLAGPAAAQTIGLQELSPATARALRALVSEAETTFARIPGVSLTSALADVCGGEGANPHMLYCTSLNRIYVDAKLAQRGMPEGELIYRLAHLYGHAVQVRYGVADIALARIRADRAREKDYRGWVTRQAECVAGVLAARAYGKGVKGPGRLFDREPYTDAHWGATPVARGPKVSIGLAAREEWFAKGAAAREFSVCAVGEFGAELILRGAGEG